MAESPSPGGIKPPRKVLLDFDLPLLESICFKKCIRNLGRTKFTYGEKNCLDHCYSKGFSAIKCGILSMGYLQKEVAGFQMAA